MKSFFASFFGTLTALFIFVLGCVVIVAGFIGLIASLGENTVLVEKGSYLVVDLSTSINDAPPAINWGTFTGGSDETLQLRSATQALRSAANDNRIAGVLITGSMLTSGYGSGFAALKELRDALADFKASGKPVKAYLNFTTTKDYYVASVADQVVIDPYGEILMPGLAVEPTFYAGALKRFGINVQVTRVGKYKSFVEPFVLDKMSDENREQTRNLLTDLWTEIVGDIAKSRGITPADVQALVDEEGLISATAAQSGKLVDRTAYRDEVIDELKAATGTSGHQAFTQIALTEYAKVAKGSSELPPGKTPGKVQGKVAVVYAEGAIVNGEGESEEVGGTRFSRELRRLREDNSVKAVVLRVNSPGGSASASEEILREVRLIKAVKPIVISMGTYAASGGYWISTYGDKIYAEATTITGSIGVFGLQFDIQKLANDYGFTFDSVKTGKHADFITIARPKTAEEMAIFQRMVDWTYTQFLDRVTDARKLERVHVAEIAQGRVWSGKEAKKLGLVDEIGGLSDAIGHAAEQAELGNDFRVVEYPRKKELGEAIKDLMEKTGPMAARSQGLSSQIVRKIQDEVKTLSEFSAADGVYARLPLQLSIQ